MEKTHKFEMDELGSFQHSQDCWCFQTSTNEPDNSHKPTAKAVSLSLTEVSSD